jgi:hypothetical protein
MESAVTKQERGFSFISRAYGQVFAHPPTVSKRATIQNPRRPVLRRERNQIAAGAAAVGSS